MTVPTSTHQNLLHTDYGKSSKELIEFVGQLRALGAHIDLELPRIVVIGNQSAGKSSLVEAISGISVPRDAGTCTRCPMECRLSYSSDAWTCQIKIRWEYEDDGRRLEEVEEVDFGPVLTDKKGVELMLRRAQAAVLYPDVSEDTFLHMKEESVRTGAKLKGRKPLDFSRNVVCMELSGPDLADLSFVDLPGIVQNADPKVVQLVEDLVNSYINGNSLILVTLPMSDDIENQKAARLAKLADPNGLRTIGVMTKPDTLTSGSTKARDLWLEVIEGRRHPLLHGYYCTRQPDDDERSKGISTAAARTAEAAFFTKTAPWASSPHRNRLGTTNLVQNISKLLTQIIRESLPALLGQVASQLESCNAQLSTLPPAITADPTAFVLALVTEFCTELAQRVRGSPNSTELVQNTRRTYSALKDTIRSSAPPFVPYKDAKHAPRDISEYVRVDANDRSARGKKSAGTIVYLEDVRKHISTCMTRELPGNVPYAAKLSLFQAFQECWRTAALECFEEVQDAFKKTVGDLMRDYFERYVNLLAVVKSVMAELVNNCAERTTNQLQTVLSLETSPFTQNGHYFSECRDKWLAKYKDARAGKGPAERVHPAPMSTSASAPASQPFSFGAPITTAVSTTKSERPSKKLPDKKRQSKNHKPYEKTKKDEKPTGGKAIAHEDDDLPHKKSKKKADKEDEDEEQDNDSDGGGDGSSSSSSSSSDERDDAHTDSSQSGSGSSQAFTFAVPSTSPLAAALSTEDQAQREVLVKETLANLARLGYTGLQVEDFGKLNPPDIYEDELQVMAEVRAYFQVAYKRVIDYIPLSIDHHFLYAFVADLQRLLFERLGLGTANAAVRCSSYIAEDPTIVTSRDELLSKRKRLENVQRALLNFGL